MQDKAVLAMFRAACGTALMITSALTGINGQIQMLAVFLLGVPLEFLYKDKSEEKA